MAKLTLHKQHVQNVHSSHDFCRSHWADWGVWVGCDSEPGLAVRIWDNDGEFLLIEAALHLPKWLKSEAPGDRVWVYEGCMHVPPLPTRAIPDLPAQPTTSQALQMLQSPSVPTLAGIAFSSVECFVVECVMPRPAPS